MSMTSTEWQTERVAQLNRTEGALAAADGYDCPICHNKGYYARLVDGVPVMVECECKGTRRSLRHLRESGLAELVQAYTFEAYKCEERWQRTALDKAKSFAADPAGSWFYLSGPSGTGKTHLCTAICHTLIQRGSAAYYMLWREDVPKLKAMVNGDYRGYEEQLQRLSTIPVLYIDDLFKGSITDADVNLAFQLINARYNRRAQAVTIISSELDIAAINGVDPAIAGRIFERSRGYNLRTGQRNWRYRK